MKCDVPPEEEIKVDKPHEIPQEEVVTPQEQVVPHEEEVTPHKDAEEDLDETVQ